MLMKGVVHMYDRKTQAAWDRRNLRTVSCRVSVADHADLGAVAAEHGTTRYGLARALLLRTLDDPARAAAFLGDSL